MTFGELLTQHREMDQTLEPLQLFISDPGGSTCFPSFHVSVFHALTPFRVVLRAQFLEEVQKFV